MSQSDRRRPSDVCRYVALGEGFTEGVGDDDRRLPNAVRGWADRIAEGLAAAAPGWEYANLAVRGQRFASVEAEQVPAALTLQPTLISLSVGERDVLGPPDTLDSVIERYAVVVGALVQTGATVLLFTLPWPPALGSPDHRVFRYDDMVRSVGRASGAVVIDPWGAGPFQRAQVWAPGGSELSRSGHAHLARHILDTLGVAPADRSAARAGRFAASHRSLGALRVRAELPGMSHRAPLLPEGVPLTARWPIPVVVPPRGGLGRLVRSGRNTAAIAQLSVPGAAGGHLVG
jgi:hypothetical protein